MNSWKESPMKYRMLAATALACGTIGGAALAQQEEGQVLVDLVNIQADIAQDLGVDAGQVPMTVIVPVAVAAKACGLDESTLEQNSVSGTDSSSSGDAAASGEAADAGDGASADAGASGEAATDGTGDAATSDTSTIAVDADGGDAAQGCIASASSPELTQAVQAEMSGATTTP